MKISNLLAGSVASLVLLSLTASAQSLIEIRFNGVCQSTNGAGQMITTRVNNQTLIQEAAAAAGLTNSSGLTLVYHINGGNNGGVIGDTIEVVDSTGALVGPYPLFGFFEFQSVTTADGTAMIGRAQDVYTLQQGNQTADEVGNAVVSERTLLDRKTGAAKKLFLNGTVLYLMLTNSATSGVCTANFIGTKPFPVQPAQ